MIGAVPLAAAFTAAVLGSSVAEVSQRYGAPAAVASRNEGNRFAYVRTGGGPLDVWADDDARVRALDVRGDSGDTFAVEVDGRTRVFAFGSYAAAQAAAELAAVADTSGERYRTFRLTPLRELVLGFDPEGHLTRVVLGDRVAVARLGFLPGLEVERTVPFVAAVLRATRAADATGSRAVVVREALDRRGDPVSVEVVVPSGDAAFDSAIVAKTRDDRWQPARLGGRAIASTVFREVRG